MLPDSADNAAALVTVSHFHLPIGDRRCETVTRRKSDISPPPPGNQSSTGIMTPCCRHTLRGGAPVTRAAISSAMKELRTSGPDATKANPIALPMASNSANSSGVRYFATG